MRIIFYKTVDDDSKVNKSIGELFSQPMVFKRDVDIIYPIILMFVGSSDYKDVNYCYIEQLKRYYFVRSIQSINNNMIQLELEVDVLMTFKDEFLNSDCRLLRGIKTGDYYDGSLERNVNVEVTKHKSGKSFIDAETIILSTLGVKNNG